MFVLDASVAAAWFFPDEVSEYADHVLDRLVQEEAMVPEIWRLEVVNVLVVGERRHRLTESEAREAIRVLRRLPIVVAEAVEMDVLYQAARVHRLSAYDAAYLELARSEDLPLATKDAGIQMAAERAGVELVG